MTSPGPDWVEQARRLVAGSGLADALNAFAAPEGPTPPSGQAGAPAGHSAECRWCPLCSGLAALRGRRPDLVEGLADVLSTAAAVLRAHAASPADGPAAARADGAPASGSTDAAPPDHPTGSMPAEPRSEDTVTQPTPPAPVQRIDVA
jgi:hypothetical protein